jgi:hypothetical protein
MRLQAFDVRKAWDQVRPGLEAIKRLTDPEWRCEDLYARILMGQAFLFMPDDESKDFVILSQYTCPYAGAKVLNVIAAYSKSGSAVAEYQPEIDEIAAEAGCTAIEFCSPREGWERHAKAHGYERKLVVYRRELNG